MKPTIGKKLGLGFGLVIGLMVASVFVAFLGIHAINESSEQILEAAFPTVVESLAVRNAVNRSVAALRGRVLAENDASKADYFLKELSEAWVEIDDRMARLVQLHADQPGKQGAVALAAAEKSLSQLRAAQLRLVETVNKNLEASEGSKDEANLVQLLESEVMPLRETVREQMEKVQESADLQLAISKEALLSSSDRTESSLVIAALLAMAVAGIVAATLSRRIGKALKQVVDSAQRIAEGDLRGEPLKVVTQDEIGDLGNSFNTMRDGLKELAKQILEATENVTTSAAEIAASTKQQATATKEQATTIQQITSTMKEITESGAQIEERARSVSTDAEATCSASEAGAQAAQEANQSMEGIRGQVEQVAENIVALSGRTQAIGELIATVTDIAERSNLLALNATIEAVSAGEQGNRFSVVANEMKNLADQAKECTVQVRSILGEIQKGIHASVMLTEEAVKRVEKGKTQTEATDTTIRRMSETTVSCVQAFQQIVGGTNQQQIGVSQVAQGMEGIRQAVEQTATGISQLEKASSGLSALSHQLQSAVRRYQV